MEEKINQPDAQENNIQSEKQKPATDSGTKGGNKKLIIIIAAVVLILIAACAIIIPMMLGGGSGKEIILDAYYYCESADATVGIFNDNTFTAILYAADSYEIIEGTYEIKNKKISFTSDAEYGGETKSYRFENGEGSIKIDGKSFVEEEIFKGIYTCTYKNKPIIKYNFYGKEFTAYIDDIEIDGVYFIRNNTLITITKTASVPENVFLEAGRQTHGLTYGENYIIINGNQYDKK